MRKIVIIAVVAAVAVGAAIYSGVFSRGNAAADAANAAGAQQGGADGRAGGGFGPGGFGGGGGGRQGGRGGGRGQLTVELAPVTRSEVHQELAVVGNLVGDQTVAVVPKTAGRLQELAVKLGDRVNRGQRIAKIEDQEILEQVKQQEAASQVASATIRQREADLLLAKTNVERSRMLFERQLLPQQTLDDSEAKYQSAQAALDLARAQNSQSQARLDELRINLQNTVMISPVNGFVARRAVDPGAFVSPNSPIVDVVDINRVRLVVNVVEKDLRQIGAGDMARVEVDAFPGESFAGRIARVSPVLDPATRTFPIEIEIPNSDFRLKPGMYARVGIVTDSHPNAIVVPSNAVVDVNGTRGVYLAVNNVAQFRPVKIGIENGAQAEILDGVSDGDRVVTTGAGALRNGDPIVLAGRGAGGGGGRGGRQNRPGGTGDQSTDGRPLGQQGGQRVQGDATGEGGFGGQRGAATEPGTSGFGARRGAGAEQGTATGNAEQRTGRGNLGDGVAGGRRGGFGRRNGGTGESTPGQRYGGERGQKPVSAAPEGPETR